MTTYKKTERRQWRRALKRFQWRINYLLALVLVLVALLPAAVQAQACPTGYPIRISHGCRSVAGNGVACDSGYEGRFRKVNGKWIGRCAPGPVVQRGQP